MNKRVMGLLGVTRSFGDNSIKEFVIAEPFISSVQVTTECKFVVMGCDGVFDVLSDEEVCVIVKKCIHQNLVQECAHQIVDEALRRDSRDNISAIVIGLCPLCANKQQQQQQQHHHHHHHRHAIITILKKHNAFYDSYCALYCMASFTTCFTGTSSFTKDVPPRI